MELLPLVCLCLLSCSGDGAPPKPSVKILDEKEDKVLLQCEVRGTFPKPTVEWQTLSGDILPVKKTEVTEEEGSYSIILETTVPRGGLYACVARLGVFGELSVSSIFAFKRSNHLETLSFKQTHIGGLIIALIVGGVTLAVGALFLLFYIYIKRRNEARSTPVPTVAL